MQTSTFQRGIARVCYSQLAFPVESFDGGSLKWEAPPSFNESGYLNHMLIGGSAVALPPLRADIRMHWLEQPYYAID